MDSKGKAKRKRPPYDPELAQAVSKRRKQHADLKAELEKAICKVIDIASSLLASDDVLQCGLSSNGVEVLLIATVGLEGLINLHHAMSVVPKNVPNRFIRIFSMLTEQIRNVSNVDKIKRCIEMLEKLCVVEGRYQRTLSPPVSCCINEKCRVYDTSGSLTKHHDPITVTIYTVTGPEIAQKQALKCKSCSFIYNYSMYGKKLTEGEHYYAEERDFIEVSDTTYCERELYELFCSLKYLFVYISFMLYGSKWIFNFLL